MKGCPDCERRSRVARDHYLKNREKRIDQAKASYYRRVLREAKAESLPDGRGWKGLVQT